MLAKDRRNEILKTLRTNGGMIKMTEIISAFPDTFAVVSTVSETLGNFKKIRN